MHQRIVDDNNGPTEKKTADISFHDQYYKTMKNKNQEEAADSLSEQNDTLV